MPKRPMSHRTEESSRNRLRDLFTQCGWVVWDLYPDYGEDLLIRIFVNEVATHFTFFVQAKSTINIDKYIQSGGKYLNFPIDVDHLVHWNRFWEPVVLTVWDAKADVTYWEIVQDFLENEHIDGSRGKKIRVKIPIENILNKKSLTQIFERTKSRFNRFELARIGTQILIKELQDKLGVKINYEAGDDVLVIDYPSSDKSEWAIFGDSWEKFHDLAKSAGYTYEEYSDFFTGMIIRDDIELGHATKEITEDGQVLLYFDGKLTESFMNIHDCEYKYDRYLYNRHHKDL